MDMDHHGDRIEQENETTCAENMKLCIKLMSNSRLPCTDITKETINNSQVSEMLAADTGAI